MDICSGNYGSVRRVLSTLRNRLKDFESSRRKICVILVVSAKKDILSDPYKKTA